MLIGWLIVTHNGKEVLGKSTFFRLTQTASDIKPSLVTLLSTLKHVHIHSWKKRIAFFRIYILCFSVRNIFAECPFILRLFADTLLCCEDTGDART